MHLARWEVLLELLLSGLVHRSWTCGPPVQSADQHLSTVVASWQALLVAQQAEQRKLEQEA